jgi:hypothetical protein
MTPVLTIAGDGQASSVACRGSLTSIAADHVAERVEFRGAWSRRAQRRPRAIRLERDGSTVIRRLRWRGWGTARARATGTVVARRGRARTARRGTVVLQGVRDCGGRLAYTRLVFRGRTRALRPCDRLRRGAGSARPRTS